jgi:hypothetical protein
MHQGVHRLTLCHPALLLPHAACSTRTHRLAAYTGHNGTSSMTAIGVSIDMVHQGAEIAGQVVLPGGTAQHVKYGQHGIQSLS